jgi:hypothetical protein
MRRSHDREPQRTGSLTAVTQLVLRLLLLGLVAEFAGWLSATEALTSCPQVAGWNWTVYNDAGGMEGGNNSCIGVTGTVTGWVASSNICEAIAPGVHLLTSNSFAGALGTGVTIARAASLHISWVGLSRQNDSRSSPWRWVDGLPFTHTWTTGEGSTGESCGAIQLGSPSKLIDIGSILSTSGQTFRALCEIEFRCEAGFQCPSGADNKVRLGSGAQRS